MSKEKRLVTIYRSRNGKGVSFPKFPQRNDACWCQSEKKYKNCHLTLDQNKMKESKQ